MNGWQATTLGEVCRLITDGKHGDCTNEENSGYYFISAKDIRDGIINYENARQITESDFAETHRRTDLQSGDLLVTNSGTIGRLAIAHDNEQTLKTTFQKSVAILKPKPCEISSRFLYYYLTANMKAFIHPAAGAAQKNLLLRDIRAFRIYKPSLHEQDNIADILSAYDDLIENNRRRIALLEAAARLLYCEWFVHFRFPGHEHVKIINGLPEGWMMQPVGDLAEIKGGKQVGGTLIRAVGPVPVYGGNGIQGYTDNKNYDGFVIVFGRVGANCGSVHWSYDGAWINNNASGLVPYEHPELLLQHMLNCNFANYRKGAAQPFIPNGMLSTIRFSTPQDNLASLFCEYARTIRLQQVTLNQQNQKLAQARDLLLPRLMNGEIVV